MLFRRKKRDKRGAEKSMADILEENLNTVNGELARLEDARKRGEIGEEGYIRVKTRLESLKREIEGMLSMGKK